MYLHFGIHGPDDEMRNIRTGRITHATTAKWIQREITRLGTAWQLLLVRLRGAARGAAERVWAVNAH